MTVYQAINAVQADLAKEGIGKDRKNEQQGYKFRGIDDVYNALAPLLAKHQLCILPRCISRECLERTNAKGTALFYVTVEAEFDFVSAVDGSKHTVRTFGEAMDSADKATNKAMSAAYKYAAFQAFAIPTEGDNDADAHHHEVVYVEGAIKPRVPAEHLEPRQKVTPNQVKMLKAKMATAKFTVGEAKDLLGILGIEHLEDLPFGDVDKAIKYIEAHAGRAM